MFIYLVGYHYSTVVNGQVRDYWENTFEELDHEITKSDILRIERNLYNENRETCSVMYITKLAS